MRFLKKASYQDIIGGKKENSFHHYEDLSSKYKEFELFLNEGDLNNLLDENKKDFCDLIARLQKNGAVISAIHCPESKFKTCNEGENELSGNYLSLCEVIRDNDSMVVLKRVFELADKICEKQAEKEKQDDVVNEDDATEDDGNSIENNKNTNNSITVILHEGCEIGCVSNGCIDDKNCNTTVEQIANIMNKLIKDLEIKSSILIALENVTPFYSTVLSEMSIGANCGWKDDNQKSKNVFFGEINEKLKDTKLQFGACIDFCHIMVSSRIVGEHKSKSEVLDEYFNNVDYGEYIFLFHVSNCGEDLSHGQLFQFEDEEDRKALEKIRFLCNQHAPKALITFEMADGTDVEKAVFNYEHIMFYFSNKHLFGKFNELLINDVNKELKDFFDNLFVIYSYDKKSVFEITNALWRVKQIILKNTFNQGKETRIFGVDFDKTEVNLSLVRLKAYVYYTRFCNLGNYLAENYYSGEKCIWNESEDIAEDFGLAMKYFIFNDKIRQCVYTGIQYKFLIDFLPKKESFVRLNDGITSIRKLQIESDNIFSSVVKKIPAHISGTHIQNGEADFYSVGKNFVKCLFKYFDSSHTDWSLKIYENVPINYVDYCGKRYSIQAFTQMMLTDRSSIVGDNEIKLSLDISRFASGRDGKATDTLEGFLKYFDGNNEFTKEKVASISDEEVLFSDLPEASRCYYLDAEDGVILKKICLSILGKKEIMMPVEVKFTEDKINKLKEKVEMVNGDKGHQVWEIVEKVKDNIKNSKMSQDDLKKLEVYSGEDDAIYNELEKFITIKIGENK